MSQSLGTTLVCGVGPGLGAAIARRFAAAGAPVALGARSPDALAAIAAAITAAGRTAIALPYDVTEEEQVEAAIRTAEQRLGPIGALIYNAGNAARGGLAELTAEEFASAWRVGPYGAFLHARRILPGMAERGRGVVLFTGATSSVHPPARSPAFGSAKFGLRGLALSISREWSPRGVHVAHVLVDGVIRTPRSAAYLGAEDAALEPDDMAEAYYQLAIQPRSSWTFEMDLRPCGDDYFEN